jgi:hypothetical protein
VVEVVGNGVAAVTGLNIKEGLLSTVPVIDVSSSTSPVGPAGDFNFSVTPASLNVTQNKSATFTLTLSSLNGFTGAVTLGANGLLPGTSEFLPSGSVSLSPANSPLKVSYTVTPNSNASATTYPVTFTADSGSIHKQAGASVVVGVAAVASLPTLSSISPSSGTAGSTASVTLTGTNFVSGGTTVTVSGAGVTVGSIQVSGTTSLTATFTIAASAATGNRSVTVTTAGGTSNSVSFGVSAPSSGSFNQTQTQRLYGTWTFSYTIVSKFTDTYRLNDVEENPTTPADWAILGTGSFGQVVIAQYSPLLNEFVLLDPGAVIDKFYTFDFTGANTVSGCYYQIQPPGSTNLSQCYPLTGLRTSSTAISRDTAISKVSGRSQLESVSKTEVEQLEGTTPHSPGDEDLLRSLQSLKERAHSLR